MMKGIAAFLALGLLAISLILSGKPVRVWAEENGPETAQTVEAEDLGTLFCGTDADIIRVTDLAQSGTKL